MRNVFTGSGLAALFGALIVAAPAPADAHGNIKISADVEVADVVGSVRRDVAVKETCDCRPVRKARTVRKVRRVYRTHSYAFYPRPVWGPVHYYVEPPVRQPLFPYEPFLPPRYW